MEGSTIKGLPPARPTEAGADINTSIGTEGLFVVCKTAGFVEFYDPRSLAQIDEIRLPDFPHEVVLSPDRRTAYVSIYGNGIVGTNTKPGTQIAMIDLETRKLSGFIELAPYLGPHGLTFDADGTLWSTAELSNCIVAIDVKRGAIIGEVQVGSHRTHWMTATPDGKKIYAPHRQLNWVSVIDVASRQVTKKIPGFLYECQGIAAAPDGNRIYQASSARPEISVIDPRTDEVVGGVRVDLSGDFPPQHTRLRVTPDNKRLVVVYNVSRQAVVLDTEDLGSHRIFPLEKGPMGIAFPDKGSTAYITNHDQGAVTVIDLKAMKIVHRFETRMGPETMTFY